MENNLGRVHNRYQPVDWNFSQYADPELAQTMRIAASHITESSSPYGGVVDDKDIDRISKIDWSKIDGDSPAAKADKAYYYYKTLPPDQEFDEQECNDHKPGREEGEKKEFEEPFSKKEWPNVKHDIKNKRIKELLKVLEGIPAICGTAVVEFIESAVPTMLSAFGKGTDMKQYFDNIDLNGKISKIDLLTNNFRVRKYYKKKLHKKDVYLLVDWSGSMCSSLEELVATLEFFLRQKERGDINRLFIGKFLHRLISFEEITDTTEFRNNFTEPRGGDTYIHRVIPELMVKLAEIRGFNQEIVVINDGDDDMDSSYISPVKMHCIALDRTNEEVRTVCLRSQGQYINLTEL